jgi:FMN phosphatase YigB (HAD superfamily)
MGRSNVVFLLDIDNTLLDNDRITGDLRHHLVTMVGRERADSYWTCFEKIRVELGYADYLGALQRYRIEFPRDPHLLTVSHFLLHYPFADRVFPHALEVIHHLKQWGRVVIVSDGDVVFQPLKIERSGITQSVDGHVLIYIHKEKEMDDVQQRYPADHYVMFDDKLHVLAGMKHCCPRVTTVFVRQGHYAHDQHLLEQAPPADVSVTSIADVLDYDITTLMDSEVRLLHSRRSTPQ